MPFFSRKKKNRKQKSTENFAWKGGCLGLESFDKNELLIRIHAGLFIWLLSNKAYRLIFASIFFPFILFVKVPFKYFFFGFSFKGDNNVTW